MSKKTTKTSDGSNTADPRPLALPPASGARDFSRLADMVLAIEELLPAGDLDQDVQISGEDWAQLVELARP